MSHELELPSFTDTVKEIDLSDPNQIVVVTAGGRLQLNRFGFNLEGPAEAMQDITGFAKHFLNHELQLKLDQHQGCLELIACRGRGKSFHHALGGLPSNWPEAFSVSTLLKANARLSAWHRRRPM